MVEYYVLDEAGVPRPEADITAWARWFETSIEQRRVAWTEIGETHVSTVFLGIDHNWVSSPPILYETMIFGGEHDQYQRRHHTAAQAMAHHDQLVAALRDGVGALP